MTFRDEKLLIFDGAYGSALSAMGLPDAAWDGRPGCTEVLNLTSPDAVRGLHRAFLDAGAIALETNTFGGSRIVLGEYGLGERVAEINAAAVRIAREATGGEPGRYVVGSVGPTTKLPSLGHIGRDAMYAAMREQVEALLGAGVDAVIIETCQDLWQAKIAALAAFDAVGALGRDVPVMLSVTLETSGAMLVGSSIDAVMATFAPFPLFSLGLNCAVGPEQMAPHVARLCEAWPGRISVMPNAGLPELRDGKAVFPLSPDELARRLRGFVEAGVSIVGGCCGTGPAHVRAVAREVAGLAPKPREVPPRAALASLYQAVELAQAPAPLVIGERMNTHGSRRFRKLLLEEAFDDAARLGPEQERRGAHALDLCVAYAGRDERADAVALVSRLNSLARAPLVIDSTRPEVIEAALEAIPGRCLVNSINLEDGGRTADRVLALAKRHGAAVVALTIGRDGMAMTAGAKLEVAKEIHALAVGKHGLAPHDLLFDALTFTLGAGDPSLEDAAVETLRAIPMIKAALPGVLTSLGVSNCSFGLPAEARPFLNSVFLHEAIRAGLDAAIVDAGSILPVARIAQDDRRACEDLVFNRAAADGTKPLAAFLAHFGARAGTAGGAPTERGRRERPEDALAAKVLDGDRADLADLLDILRARRRPIDIINGVLVPAMRRVGDLFGRGEMLLPFVLKSAEVVKECVRQLEPHMERSGDGGKVRVLLATVAGDVHDIGKNLVDILLTNNGYEVVNLGINVPAERIVEEARARRVDAVGLSGLLVKSALEMSRSLSLYRDAGLTAPILLGGAALSARFVAEECAPRYGAPVVYCADAFAGLAAMRELESGTLRSTAVAPKPVAAAGEGTSRERTGARAAIDRTAPVPVPPFLGERLATGIDPAALFPLVDRELLYRARWGFRRGSLSEAEHRAIIGERAAPAFDRLKERLSREGMIEPKVAYGWFRARSEGDRVLVDGEGGEIALGFPRQRFAPHLCLADYFRTGEEGGDVIGVFVGTIGGRALDEARRLFEADAYQDYLLVHGLATELADALAELWHGEMRRELGVAGGQRYGVGYPACPDLSMQRALFDLVRPERIGVSLTDLFEMVPETTTSAIVVHHPAADYFPM